MKEIERNITPMRSDISRFSRGTGKRVGELIQWSWRRPGTKPSAPWSAGDSLPGPIAGPAFLSSPINKQSSTELRDWRSSRVDILDKQHLVALLAVNELVDEFFC
jgi:hypothetical protein